MRRRKARVVFSTLYKLDWLPLTNISTKIGLAINNGGKYEQNGVGGRTKTSWLEETRMKRVVVGRRGMPKF